MPESAAEGTGPSGDGQSGPQPSGFAGYVARIREWISNNLVETLITAAIGFAVGWFINVYVVAVRYEGTGIFGSGGTATVSGNWITGSLFWMILAAVLTTLISYGRRVGPQRLVAELIVLPRNLAKGFTGGTAAWSMALFGAALSLVVAVVFGAAAAGVSGLALLLIAASPVAGMLGRGLRTLGIKAISLAAADDAERLSSASSITSVLGAALGMVVAWQLPGMAAKLVTAAIALIASVLVLKGGGGASQTAASIVLGGLAVIALRELFDGVAFADDGGWQEGGGNLGSWLGSPGAADVMTQSTVAGGMAGAGSVTGAATGQILASTVNQAGLGGLSGEWGAQDAGVEPIAPSTSPPTAPQTDAAGGVVPPPVTGDPDQGTAGGTVGPPSGGPGSGGAGGGGDAPAAQPDGTGSGDGGTTSGKGDDASLGGLSGQWSGQGPPPEQPPGAGPEPGQPGGEGGPPLAPPPDDGKGKS